MFLTFCAIIILISLVLTGSLQLFWRTLIGLAGGMITVTLIGVLAIGTLLREIFTSLFSGASFSDTSGTRKTGDDGPSFTAPFTNKTSSGSQQDPMQELKSAMGYDEACSLLSLSAPFTHHDIMRAFLEKAQACGRDEALMRRLDQARAYLLKTTA